MATLFRTLLLTCFVLCSASDSECQECGAGDSLLQKQNKLRSVAAASVTEESGPDDTVIDDVKIGRCQKQIALTYKSNVTSRSKVPAVMQEIFDQHQLYRCMHDVPLFEWHDELAAQAQAWADAGEWGHGSQAERTLPGYGLAGENLAWGYPVRSGLDSVQAWYDEIELTDGSPEHGSDTLPGKSGAIGHYTQVVWKGSTLLGCGKGRANMMGNDGDYWVCQYYPAGNMMGAYTQNVNAPVNSASDCQSGAGPSPSPPSPPSPPPSNPAPTPAPAPTPPGCQPCNCPGEPCEDDATWVDSFGDSCADYNENEKWCQAAAEWAVDGVSAADVCCICKS
eukprot:CAMPEP_0178398462 /NCGR_PEP_ID=MMETSP0689_2-20121128/14785_1 /TAXON_ID=160604 /ORGANISM="Amphidinium massartii, Strain CS-259" /LENGTH=336 /DNA_ID=CAMNT_0020019225 /DNA_START=79 /DNA_END=1089 /DNA_ORIENTATION=-